jgi:hypothetical protein
VATSDLPYLRSIEWETCSNPIEFRLSGAIAGLPPGPQSITIHRDEQYRLTAEIIGTADQAGFSSFHQSLREQVPGTIGSDGVDVVVADLSGQTRLQISLGGTFSFAFETPHRVSWTAQRHVYSYQRREQNRGHPNPPLWHTDWYLNGPKHFVFDRPTDFRSTTIHVRDRGDGRKLEFSGSTAGGGALDHVVVTAGELEFVVHVVPNPFGPPWSKNIAIDFGPAVPTDEVREAIGEIVGFAVGRRLIFVGSTTFDSEGHRLMAEARSPWDDESQSTCARHDDAVLEIGVGEGVNRLENVLGNLVPRYLKARAPLRLKDALWNYWLAAEAPLGLDLPIYSAAVEALKAGWFKSEQSKAKGTYIDKARFSALLEETFTLAENALKDEPSRFHILRKMKNCFQMSGNEQLSALFDELGLPIGTQERAAIKARNSPAHGGGAAGDAELTALHRHSATYKVLFERVFLKILGYEGTYIDRSSVGFPLRCLDEPPGGADPSRS